MRFTLPGLSRFSQRPSAQDFDLLKSSELMNGEWYKSFYYDLRDIKEDPILHYLRYGAAERRDPSPDFDTAFYLSEYPDVAAAGVNPLVHYLRLGAAEGRRPSADYILATSVEDAEITCLQPVKIQDQMVLIVAKAPGGRVFRHLEYFATRFSEQKVSPIVVVASNETFLGVSDELASCLGGLYVREDDGQDFCAWAHVIRLNPELLNVDVLILANDQLLGPIDDLAFTEMLAGINSSNSDIVGLTDQYSDEWHIDPYFVALKSAVLKSDNFRRYISTIVSYNDRSLAFKGHTLRLLHEISKIGLEAGVSFPMEFGDTTSNISKKWRELTSQGFPFINTRILQRAHNDPSLSDWRLIVSAHGFDPSLADDVLAFYRSEAISGHDLRSPKSPRKKVSIKVEPSTTFSPDFYLFLYTDVASIDMDPLYHFRTYGRDEGRIGALPGADRLSKLSMTETGRETVLIVSHDATRTGCPILSLNIASVLQKKYNVVALFLGPGPMLQDFKDAGITVIGPVQLNGEAETTNNLIKYIHQATPLKFALTNSVESRHVLPAMARLYIPAVSLIHEFGAYTTSSTAFRDAVRWAGETVFSAHITRDDAIRSWPILGAKAYPIIPQGRCLPPQLPLRPGALKAIETETLRVRRILRPESFPNNGFVIVGIGTVQLRKGVDLFLDCAAKVLATADLPACRFVWIGRGYRPKEDFEYSAYLADQIRRAGMGGSVAFMGETTEIREVYAQANLLLLTSRLDPLPNVAIEAMEDGLPVICFDKTTGIAEILSAEGLGDELVAGYLDVDDMARKLVALIRSPEQHRDISARARQIVASTFDMSAYVSRLEAVAEDVAIKAKQEQTDVETIMAHRDLIRLDYHIAPQQTEKRLGSLVREYVRAWASEIDMRKLTPGFHPGVYLDRHGVERDADPLADYLRQGKPEGPWSYSVITPRERPKRLAPGMRVGLHVHVHYPELLPDVLERLNGNRIRPDLLISITDAENEKPIRRLVRNYSAEVIMRVTPNRGRDIGPLLTEFNRELTQSYDIIGHVHTKKTADISDANVGRTWYRFLLENLIGGRAPMADVILGRMAEQPELGLVFADDPHVVGWDANRSFVEPYLQKLSIDVLSKYMHVPVGTMFWARPKALESMFALGFNWDDYPHEPLEYDGSLMHGLERLFCIVTEKAGYSVAGVNCPGVTR